MSDMTIHLGQTSPTALQNAREAAPSYRYGYTWLPEYMTPHDTPYIFDNGVFGAWRNDKTWSHHLWMSGLDDLDDMPRNPEFVVLPGVVGEAEQSLARSQRYADRVDGYTKALAVQDGMDVENAVVEAIELDCEWIFVGGTMAWKRRYADRFVMTAHDYGLKCHIARPGLPDGLMWAERVGADSVDTTTIARGQSYHHLETLEEQTELPI